MEKKKIKILWIGNSLTERNCLPEVFAKVAMSLGYEVEWVMVAPDGCTLIYHWHSRETISAIEANEWDIVVLQEQGGDPAMPYGYVADYVIPYASRLIGKIRQKSPNAQIVLFETWPGKNSFCLTRQWIRQTYEVVARQNPGAVIASVGTAWHLIREEHCEIELYQKDGVHPTLAGTIEAAYVFCATIFGQVAGAKLPWTDSAHDKILREIAHKVVLGR